MGWVTIIILVTIILIGVGAYMYVRKRRRARWPQAQPPVQGQQQLPPVGQQRIAVEGINQVPNAVNVQAYQNYNAYNNPNAQVIYVPRQ